MPELLWHIATDLGYPDRFAVFVNEATDWEYAWEIDPDESRRTILQEAGNLLATMTAATLDQEPAS